VYPVPSDLEAAGVSVVVVGEARPSSEGITIVTNGDAEPLTPPAAGRVLAQ